MGLKEILDEINRESDQEYSGAIEAARFENNKLIIDAIDDLERKKVIEEEALALELKRMRIKLTAKAELDVYRERQKLEVSMIGSLLDDAFAELLRYIKQDREAYVRFLARLIRSSIELIGATPVSVSFSMADRELFGELSLMLGEGVIKLAEDVKISGGVICMAQGSYVDNSIENIYEKNRPDFLKMIYDELNKGLSYERKKD